MQSRLNPNSTLTHLTLQSLRRAVWPALLQSWCQWCANGPYEATSTRLGTWESAALRPVTTTLLMPSCHADCKIRHLARRPEVCEVVLLVGQEAVLQQKDHQAWPGGDHPEPRLQLRTLVAKSSIAQLQKSSCIVPPECASKSCRRPKAPYFFSRRPTRCFSEG